MTSSKELKAAGLKSTLPRRKILEVMENNSSRHMNAEDVYHHLRESGEDVGLATVYRVLTQFESAGLVTKHNLRVVILFLSLSGRASRPHPMR